MVTWVDTMGTMQRGKKALACAPEDPRLPPGGAGSRRPHFLLVFAWASRAQYGARPDRVLERRRPWVAHARVSAVTTVVEARGVVLEKAWSDGLPVVTSTEARVPRLRTGIGGVSGVLRSLMPLAVVPTSVRTMALSAERAGGPSAALPIVLGGWRSDGVRRATSTVCRRRGRVQRRF
jgi:hypothetical protein